MVQYREVQRFPIWADLLLLVVGSVVPILALTAEAGKSPPWVWVIPAFFLLLWLCAFRMLTEVDERGITVTFGWIPTYRRTFRFEEIASADAVQYNPIRDYGGWGIRGLPVSCLNARGNLGVMLHLRNGLTMLIGSQAPHEMVGVVQPRLGTPPTGAGSFAYR